MQPDHTPEQIDAQFSQIVHQSYGGNVPPPMPALPPPPPRVRRPWGRWIGVAVGIVAVFCVASTVVVVKVADLLSQPRARTSPAAQEPPEMQRVRAALDRQRSALLGGDEAGYLSIIDPTAGDEDRQAMRRQFAALRAMKVSEWRDDLRSPIDRADGRWSVEVASKVCFVTSPCDDGFAVAETVWLVTADAATLVDWEAENHPHPWQLSELVSASGERTVVATTKEHASRLPSILRAAEEAAVVADRFAYEKKPARYVVYFAGRSEWQRWFRLNLADWTGAVAVSVSDHRYEVVLNGSDMSNDAVAGHLRHELTHASTLPGRHKDNERLWWLKEGIAELAEANGAPMRHHPGLLDAADALAASTTGFELAEPANSATDEQVSGAYAVAYLAVRCLSERFGERRMVEFFHAVVHEDATYVKASAGVFGVDWSVLNQGCLDYVTSAVS
ncbi:hypothetical protein [Allorhizocola rhizosphaerae]|uniref:hypothetical protein n=1 Tax=Allorhizocola rhizosphaerae TaxID=1872709 RepID=UPI000E3DABA2|nr:hypothetical protein [Allorhizocola rhizosphaerae]